MRRRATKKAISMALAAAMAFSQVQVFAASSDIKGHWAESAITSWQDKGLISGYTDGTFKPDNSITRAEFASMVNKSLGLTEKGDVPFSDVKSGSWYYDAISIAVKAGYCSGYEDGTFKPDATITRAEAAVMIALAKGLTQNTAAASGFADAANIPAWAKGYVGAVVSAGYMSGRPNGTFDATNTITRAEAVSSLDRAMGNTAVTDKDVVVTEDDTVIDGQTIEGNLIIDKAVGEGKVYVKNSTVAGNIIVQGGGDDSIYLENVTVKGKVIVEKSGVRVQFEGKTEATDVEVKAVCELKGRNFEGKVGTITIAEELGTSEAVKVNVPAEAVVVSEKASVYVNANVDKVTIASDAKDSKLEVTSSAKVGTVVADGKVAISGSGKVEKLEANADGITVSSSTTITKTEVADGVEKPSTPSTGGGGGGSSSSSTTSKTKTVNVTSAMIAEKTNLQTIITENEKTKTNLTLNVPSDIAKTQLTDTLEYKGNGKLTINVTAAETAQTTLAAAGTVTIKATNATGVTITGKDFELTELKFNAPKASVNTDVKAKTVVLTDVATATISNAETTAVTATKAASVSVPNGQKTTVTVSDSTAISGNVSKVVASGDVSDIVTINGTVKEVEATAATTIAGSGAIDKITATDNITVNATAVKEVAVSGTANVTVNANVPKVTVADGATTTITVKDGVTVDTVDTKANITVTGAGTVKDIYVTNDGSETTTIKTEGTITVDKVTGDNTTISKGEGTSIPSFATKLEEITDFTAIPAVTVDADEYLSTADLAAAKLPTSVELKYDGGTVNANITKWTCADYSASKKEAQTFTATYEMPLGYKDAVPTSVTATITLSATQTEAVKAVTLEGFTAPVKGATPDTAVTVVVGDQSKYTAGEVTWAPTVDESEGKFAPDTAYTATVVLTAKEGYTFVGIEGNTGITITNATGGTINGVISGEGKTLTITVSFEKTDAVNAGSKAEMKKITISEVAVAADKMTDEPTVKAAIEAIVGAVKLTEGYKATVATGKISDGNWTGDITVAKGDTPEDTFTKTFTIAIKDETAGAKEAIKKLAELKTVEVEKGHDNQSEVETAIEAAATELVGAKYTVEAKTKDTYSTPNWLGTITIKETSNEKNTATTEEMTIAVTEGLTKLTTSDVIKANIDDRESEKNPFTSNDISIDSIDESAVNTVKVLTKDLKEHQNGDSPASKGYWTGFAVKAPADATQMKYISGVTTEGELIEGSLSELTETEGAVDGASATGIGFYANVTATPSSYDKLYYAVQFFNAKGEAVTAMYKFKMDLSEVTIASDGGVATEVSTSNPAAVEAKAGTELSDASATITVTGADSISTGGITVNPSGETNGITATVGSASRNTVTINLSGTPTNAEATEFTVTIPASAITASEGYTAKELTAKVTVNVAEADKTDVSTSNPAAVEAKAGTELSAKSATITVTGASSSTPITTDSITIDDQTGSTGSTKNGITAKVGTADSNGTVKIDLTGTPSAKEATTFTVKIPAEAITAEEGYTAKELTATVTVNVAEADKTDVSAENPAAVEATVGTALSKASATITVTGASSSAAITTDNITIDDQTGSTGSTKNGITAKVVAADSNGTVKISLEGTPDASAASAPQTFTVKIPAGAITADEGYAAKELSVTVTVNVAKAEISEATVKGLVAPVKDETPVAKEALSIAGNDNISVESIAWTTTDDSSPVVGNFGATTTYTATITLKAKDGYKFAGSATGKVYNSSEDDLNSAIVVDSGISAQVGGTDNDTLTITVKFNATLGA